MFNDLENQTNDTEEIKMIKNLKILTWMTVILGILRIFSLEIMLLLSDLLSALMIYFYARSRNKCMAIFCGINGVIGIIYAIIKFFSSWTVAKNNWFSLYYNFLVCITIYALLTYAAIIYFAYLGIKRYEMMPLSMPSQQPSSYGAVDVPTKTNYVAFSGKGTAIGN
jgi:hypothetical protein